MIYCVVPQELAPELYDKMLAYYADDPNVTVIIDRRKAERRRGESVEDGDGTPRTQRDRRRPRIAGDFPPIADDLEE